MTATTQTMTNYLSGMVCTNAAAVREIATYDDWPQMARRILDERHAEFLRRLPQHDLQAIADGTVDLNAAAKAALGGLF